MISGLIAHARGRERKDRRESDYGVDVDDVNLCAFFLFGLRIVPVKLLPSRQRLRLQTNL